MGLFTECPFLNCHFSPFSTCERSNANHRKVIVDLSWPQDASVNLCVDKNLYLNTDFSITFPTVDTITDALSSIGPGAHLYKDDISRAFRLIRIDLYDSDLLGLKWRDLIYFYMCLPFGSRHGMQIFQHLSDTVNEDGFDIINYIDDFVDVGTPSIV